MGESGGRRPARRPLASECLGRRRHQGRLSREPRYCERLSPSIDASSYRWFWGDLRLTAVSPACSSVTTAISFFGSTHPPARLQRRCPYAVIKRAPRIGSPDSHPRLGLEVQPLARTNVEGVVPRIQIADGGETVHLGRVVSGELRAHGGIAHLRAPGLSERDEKLPVLLPHIAPVSRSLAERFAVCVERRRRGRRDRRCSPSA